MISTETAIASASGRGLVILGKLLWVVSRRFREEHAAAAKGIHLSTNQLKHIFDASLNRLSGGNFDTRWWNETCAKLGHKVVPTKYLQKPGVVKWLRERTVRNDFISLATNRVLLPETLDNPQTLKSLLDSCLTDLQEDVRVANYTIEAVLAVLVAGYLASLDASGNAVVALLQALIAEEAKGHAKTHMMIQELGQANKKSEYMEKVGKRLSATPYGGFVGREKYVRNFKEFMKSDLLLLNFYGVSGIGKSWLLNRLIYELGITRVAAASVECKNVSESQVAFYDAVFECIGSMRMGRYARFMYENGSSFDTGAPAQHLFNQLIGNFFEDISDIASTTPLVLFVDSYERIHDRSIDTTFRYELGKRFPSGNPAKLKIVVCSQKPIEDNNIDIQSHEVEGFDMDELPEFASVRLKTKSPEVVNLLHGCWGGDPLRLDVLARRLKSHSQKGPITLELIEEMMGKAGEDADEILERNLSKFLGVRLISKVVMCAVPRRFNAGFLAAMSEGKLSEDEADLITRKIANKLPLDSQSNQGASALHDRYREALLRNLIRRDSTRFQRLNEACRKELSKIRPPTQKERVVQDIEMLYYLIACDPRQALLEYNNLRYRFFKGKRQDHLEALQRAAEESLSFCCVTDRDTTLLSLWVEYGRVIEMLGRGKPRDASAYLANDLLPRVSTVDDDFIFLKARLLTSLGDLFRLSPDFMDKAMDHYDEAIALWEDLTNNESTPLGVNQGDTVKSLAETYLAKARPLEVLGRLRDGEENLRKCLDTYRKAKDLGPTYGEALRQLGRNYRLQGRWAEAHEQFNAAETHCRMLLDKAGNDPSLAGRYEELKAKLHDIANARAALWKEEGYLAKAKPVLIKTVLFQEDFAKEIGQPTETLCVAYIDLGDVFRLGGNLEEARKYYLKAEESLNSPRISKGVKNINAGYPQLGLAETALLRNNLPEAFERLEKAKEAFKPVNYLRKLSEVAICQAKAERFESLEKAYSNLETAWDGFKGMDCNYAKFLILVTLAELAKDLYGAGSAKFDEHVGEARILAEGTPFANHLKLLA